MNLLKAIYSCSIRKSHLDFFIKCISTISWAILLSTIGGLCGVAVNDGFFSESAITHLSIGMTILIVMLKDNDYSFIRPLSPLVSHKFMAAFRVLNAIFSAYNVILVCVLVPFYFVTHENLVTFDFFASCILLNMIFSLIMLNLEPLFSRFKRAKMFALFLAISYCSFVVIFWSSDIILVVDLTSIHLLSLILIPFVCLLVIVSYFRIKNNYPELYGSETPYVKSFYSYKMRGIFWTTIQTFIKQYFRCPAYKKIFPSVFAILLLGAFLCKADGAEYIGATMFIAAYSLSMLQYSSSSLSKSPDLFFSAPNMCHGFLYAFSVINVIVASIFCIAISFYIKFVACKSIIPVLSIWGFVCGPLSKAIMTCAVFPIRIDLWSKNPELNRTPVQVFISAAAAFAIILIAFLIQFKTVESSIIIGIISLVSFLTYHKHISFLETKINQRKYIIINTLR